MSASVLMVVALLIFITGYIWYGRFLTKKFDLDGNRPTPAHTMKDGVDYVPAKAPILLGHHFSSIAGAGPILGPIFAAIFGWIPVFLWILLGSVFIGGVHDFSSLIASVRHGGKSIGEVIEDHIGKDGKKLFLIFAWFTLILVIAVFSKIVATTFVTTPAAASSSALFIALAVLFGVSIYRWKVPLGLATVIGVALLVGCVVVGTRFPLQLSQETWIILLFAYVFIAAVTPVWILLQPRDFLNSFLLYMVLLGGVVGIFVSNPRITFPAITGFRTELGLLFPILFVTVACGAISGFHSLVSGGTTSKQLNRETDARVVGYGSMLIEGVLAVVALITAVTVSSVMKGQYHQWVSDQGPISIFSRGVGSFMSSLGIPEQAGVTFAALAISAFCLTTLDTATRLARFMLEDFFEREWKPTFLSNNRYISTFITVIVAGLFAFSGTSTVLWPMFGSANQLLAAITLLAVTVWLSRMKKKTLFVKIPMVFMFLVALAALGSLIYKHAISGNITLLCVSIILFIVAVFLVIQAQKKLRKSTVAPG